MMILMFRSRLLRYLETLALSPLLVAGAVTQRQQLAITYLDTFTDTAGMEADTVVIEIMSTFIQVIIY